MVLKCHQKEEGGREGTWKERETGRERGGRREQVGEKKRRKNNTAKAL